MLDNVFRDGRVLDADDDDPRTRATREVNERAADDERVDVVVLAVADGITLARKR
jgi:predicted O-methyltransferase YrrM